MNKLSLTRKELESFASNTLGFDKKAMRRMSTLFLGQLLQMKITGDNALSQMAREVRCLERYHPPGPGLDDCSDFIGGPMNEWVIFKRHNGTNYYLTLARLNDGDQSINRRVRQAYDFDFPYLRGNA